MIVRLPFALRPPQNDSMVLRSMGFFPGRLAALVLWLGAACFPPFAVAGDVVGPWGEAADRQHGFHPFALKYGIVPYSRSDIEISLGSPDEGTLRFETAGEEPLPPVVVDNEPEPVPVNPLAISVVPAPAEILPGESPVPVDTPEMTAQPAPPRERPHRRPRARLTRLHVSQKRPPAAVGGVKPSDQNRKDLTISFTGIDPGIDHEARAVKFRYRLDGEGLNEKWIETDGRSAQYSDLQPGKYRFEVQAADDGGLWSEPTVLFFTVIPPFWRRDPFLGVALAGVGIVLTGSLYSAVRSRRLLQMERLRASIAANLHDQIGAGLTDIAILSEVAVRKAGNLPELVRVAATARDLVDGLGDIVWLVNPRRDSLYELFVRLKDAYAELFAHAGAQLEVGDLSPLEGAHLPMAYRQDLHLLFQEALRNALRHSGCRRAHLSVTLHGRHLEVELRDDGRGFNPECRGGEGLETMSRRAERLGGRLGIESSAKGTVVRFVGRMP